MKLGAFAHVKGHDMVSEGPHAVLPIETGQEGTPVTDAYSLRLLRDRNAAVPVLFIQVVGFVRERQP